VSIVYPAYPGPKNLGPELERLRLEGISCDTDWIEYCLNCYRCNLVCPNQVDISGMINMAKAHHKKPLIRKMRDFWFSRPWLLGRLLTIMPRLTNLMLNIRPVRLLMSRLLKISSNRIFPIYIDSDINVPIHDVPKSDSVIFFLGCSIRYNQPDLGRKVVLFLQRIGIKSVNIFSGCCGLPALANGDIKEARVRARSNTEYLIKDVLAGSFVVAACTSCGHMLKTCFDGLLDEDSDMKHKVQKIAKSTFDFGEFLMSRSDLFLFDNNISSSNLRIAYHAPCHQISQGIGRPWFHLLKRIPNLQIEDLDAGCCGMSGTFGFKEEKYKISMDIGQRLFDSIRDVNPQMVVTECATCRMQIEHGVKIKTIHPAELLLDLISAKT
jgi:glycerol-3-phosphate dehydrogenase subunit C